MTAYQAAFDLARCLQGAGHRALFAGGCVRDRLLGQAPQDYDIATSALPSEVLELFPGSNEVGAHFGVVIVKHDGHHVEVATFRTDGSYRDGRRPESVVFSNPEEDAKRRDFTINGMFEDPVSGEVIDYVGGMVDLSAGVIRAIGNPRERFQEDALRLLRAIRFASRLGHRIDEDTECAILECAPMLARISPERIRDEFSKIITSSRRRQGLEQLVSSGLMDCIVPEFLATQGCEQPPEWHPEGDVFTHTLIMLEMLDDAAPLELCLAVLLHDIAKPPCRSVDADGRIRFNGHDAEGAKMAVEIMRRLRFPNQVTERVAAMVGRHMQFMNVQKMRVSTLKRFMSSEDFALELELHRVDCASSNGLTDNYDFLISKREEFAAEPLLPRPLITGRDLISMGLHPGPEFKKLLTLVQTEQLEGKLVDRDQAMEFIRSKIHYNA